MTEENLFPVDGFWQFFSREKERRNNIFAREAIFRACVASEIIIFF